MEIKQQFIPAKYTRIRPGIPLNPTYITVHETSNTAKGADAEAHARLLSSGNQERVASWHFTVDDKEIIQHIPENEVAWHAGDGGNGPGNRKSLSLEICVNEDGNYEKAKENAVWLVRYLMSKHNIPIGNVVPHKHWTGKDCPHNLLPHWNEFIKQVEGAPQPAPAPQPAKPAPQPPKYTRLLRLTSPMMRGEDVKLVQQKLGIAADGIYGPNTKAAVMKFQKDHGLAVDGIVGPNTWGKLFA